MLMTLPGGPQDDGPPGRTCTFAPLTGEIELALGEAAHRKTTLPALVTSVLCVVLDDLAGRPATTDRVRALSVGDRQFLIRRLGIELDTDECWLTGVCEHCGQPIDVAVRQSALPYKPATDGYPIATAQTSLGECRVRVPTGLDQEAMAVVEDESAAADELARRCVLDLVPGRELDPAELTERDLEILGEAVESVAPEMVTEIQASCPHCSGQTAIAIDPYRCLRNLDVGVLRQVHTLASAYHWSEAEILALPRQRRLRYLQMIDDAELVD
jgi:hypothetical protein